MAISKHRLFKGINSLLLMTLATAWPTTAKSDLLREGRDAFMNYDFELASELYSKYAQTLKKKPDPTAQETLDKFLLQLEIAENSLENVQKIEVIDRIDISAENLLKAIRLPPYGGQLLEASSTLPSGHRNESDFVFSSESGDLLLWSETNSDSRESIMQSELLLDGSWEEAQQAGEILNDGGNARNPFMLTDGMTLYFSCDGEGSMGGYDIFVATRDPSTGEFKQPTGVGFPFNSPFNEYMLAIDEANGIGWWVTDRNGIDGEVSVYIFKTNDVRRNYQADEEEDIISLARLNDITITQNTSTDYPSIIRGIEKRSQDAKTKNEKDFVFALPGRMAYHLSDFKNAGARRNMEKYLQASAEYESEKQQLDSLRRKYHASDKKSASSSALKTRILDLEQQLDQHRIKLDKMRNAVINSEMNH